MKKKSDQIEETYSQQLTTSAEWSDYSEVLVEYFSLLIDIDKEQRGIEN